ncbi:MAG: hypothetical protein AAGD14_14505 [Planctomycetota bacterium]
MTLQELTLPLRRGLGRLRSRVRSLLVIYGTARAVVFLVTALLVLFAADYVLRLPLGVRQFALLLLFGGLGVVLYRRLVRPLQRPLPDALLAAHVERDHPELQDRLVSSLAFLEAERDPENSDSPELMRAVIEETVQITPRIRFADAARSRNTTRWASGAAAMFALVVLLASMQPTLASTFVQRDLLLRDVAWPRRTTIAVLDMEPGVAREVTLHHDTTLQFRVEGAIPDRLELRFREESDRDGSIPAEIVELAPSAEDPALFTYTLHVDADYAFSITGGDDDRADTYRVKALTPPSVTGLELRCTFPTYLGLAPETRTDGDQRIPEGTKIDMRVKTNMPLQSASLVVAGSEPVALEKLGDREYRTALAPDADLRYSFLLVGPRGERNEPHTYVVRVSRDRAPDLRVRTPGARADRSPDGVALISFRARDDHRLDKAEFHYRINEGEERTVALGEAGGAGVRFLRGAQDDAEDAADDAADDAAGERDRLLLGLIALDLAQLRRPDGKPLREDDRLEFRIEVTDSAGKRTSTSQRGTARSINIAPSNQFENDIDARQRDLLEGLERTERQALKAGLEILGALNDDPTADDGDDFQRQLGRGQAGVGRMVDQLGQLAGEVRGLVNLYVFNRLDDKATAEQALPLYERFLLRKPGKGDAPFRGELYRALWQAQQDSTLRAGGAYLPLLEMADLADRLVADTAPQVYATLRKAARPGLDRAEARVLLQRASDDQQSVSEGLQRLRRLMREWQTYDGVVRALRRLKDDQSRIVEELKKEN